MQRLLGSSNPAGRLHPDRDTRREIEIPNRLDHHLSVGERRATRRLASARLYEIARANRLHRQKGRRANVVVRVELAHFEDDLQLRFSARFHYGADLVLHRVELTREKKPAVDDHVDLVGAVRNRGSYFLEPKGEWALA